VEEEAKKVDCGPVWHYEGFRVKVQHLYYTLIELKIYQHNYNSIRDALEDKYSGDGGQVGRKKRELQAEGP
jgi:hypothetical protein